MNLDGLTLTDITAFGGLAFGLTGFVLGVLNYRRDRARVTVNLTWDLTLAADSAHEADGKWGIITVANVGRRPIYVSHASLRLPRGYGASHLLLPDSVPGKKLAEGDPPLQFLIDQADVSKYAKDWRGIRAEIIDSTRRKWRSKRPTLKERPSWAIENAEVNKGLKQLRRVQNHVGTGETVT
jgi:hypothetical protein